MTKQLVVITGASSGIGEAIAKKMASLGHPLLLLARRVEKLESLKLPNTICAKVDVTNLEDFKQAVLNAESKYGKTDLIVNNAGVMLLSSVKDQDPAEWKQMFDVNVMGVLNGMKIVLNDMVSRKGGTIVNVSSIAGINVYPDHGAYCGTKFAVHAISEATRKEVAQHNVRVTIVSPGVVETELLSHTTNNDIIKGYQDWKSSGMGSGLSAANIADYVAFIYQQPQSVNVRDLVITPTMQVE